MSPTGADVTVTPMATITTRSRPSSRPESIDSSDGTAGRASTGNRRSRARTAGECTRPDASSLPSCMEAHRQELRRHCQRMLGSGFEAEDAVQETLVRAWRAYGEFDGRSSLRHWLFRIATNVCFSMLRGPQRRARPMDMTATANGAAEMAFDVRAASAQAHASANVDAEDPADLVASRDAVRRALVVALRALPPRQRAALILQDVLRWRASEVAELLESTEVSVRSALQRARTALAAPTRATTAEPDDDAGRRLLAGYVDAFEHTDVTAIAALLRFDHLTHEHSDRATAAA
jgi:RNA polymerase sigma-70 factor (ECF subfamily)